MLQLCIYGLAVIGGLCILCFAIMVGLFLSTSYRLRNARKQHQNAFELRSCQTSDLDMPTYAVIRDDCRHTGLASSIGSKSERR